MTTHTDQLTTDRLLIRHFTPADWVELQELARDRESSAGGKYDHAWPTDDEGCRGMAVYFAAQEKFWAVCLRNTGHLIGLLALSPEDEPGVMEVGHVFHTAHLGADLDTEALGCLMDVAFADPSVRQIICRNAEEWEAQLAPLRKLGLTVVSRGDGTDFFQRNADGNPITFVGCTMAIGRDEWLQRRR
ncbi:GNAT family N-acetyltransferase [bacterium]|nr:GNAT family N-acetyltransferase [bacterium]